MIKDILMAAAGGEAAPARGQAVLTDYSSVARDWVVPEGVESICVVCVGSGCDPDRSGIAGLSSNAGGGLSYSNDIPVTPGEVLSYELITYPYTGYNKASLKRGSTVLVSANNKSTSTSGAVGNVKYGGGAGGTFSGNLGNGYGGGGGAAGYAGAGGRGGNGATSASSGATGGAPGATSSGAGGGGGGGTYIDGGHSGNGGGGRGGGGGGVGLNGIGSTGQSSTAPSGGGRGGSNGATGTSGSSSSATSGGNGGAYGGGTGGGGLQTSTITTPGNGAIRIIWGEGRSYPNNAGDV